MAISIRLNGVLRGYSSSESNNIGNFYVDFKCSSINRLNSGNSETVTFKDCYIQTVPCIEKRRYTSNTIYIDSVSIDKTSLGISANWVGMQYQGYKYNDGSKVYWPVGCTTSSVTKNLTFSRTTTSATITLYGHRSGQSANAQVLTGTITFDAGWSNIFNKPTINIEDHGNNTATISGTLASGGTNNHVKESWLYYTTNGKRPAKQTDATTGTTGVKLSAKEDNSYSAIVQLGTVGGTKIIAIVCCAGQKGDSLNSDYQTGNAFYYANPRPPADIDINSTNNVVTITATPGSGVSNNNPIGVEIFYTTNGEQPGDSSNKYTGPFNIDESTRVRVAARTVGEYNGNNELYRYSGFTQKDSEITAYSQPGPPTNLQILNNYNNSFTISCYVGVDHIDENTANTAEGVEIFYTTDGTSPSLETSSKIVLYGSTGSLVTSSSIPVNSHTTVRAIARTKGTVESVMYSEPCAEKKNSNIFYYEKSTLNIPVINYDKKLTKKSKITIKHGLFLQPYTRLESYNLALYWKDSPIFSRNTFITGQVVGGQTGKEYSYDTNIELGNIENVQFKKDDKLIVEIKYNTYPVKSSSSEYSLPLGGIVRSNEYIIQSNGVMKVNVNNNWYEGQVWVNVDGIWHEATDVFINIDGSWKESI